jgi:hypothetical protein
MEMSGKLHMKAALLPRKDAGGLGGLQSGSGSCGEEKNLALPGMEPRPYPITILTEQSILLCIKRKSLISSWTVAVSSYQWRLVAKISGGAASEFS